MPSVLQRRLHLPLLAYLGATTDAQQEIVQLAVAAGLPMALVQEVTDCGVIELNLTL